MVLNAEAERLIDEWRHKANAAPLEFMDVYTRLFASEYARTLRLCADELDTALRACADPPEESRDEQDLSAILQSVLQMIGLPGFNAAWFDEHGDWDFGKLRDHGLDAKLAEIRAALRACAEAPSKEKMPDWQPMETAPKDGTTILVTLNDYNIPSVDFGWHDGQHWRNYEDAALSPLGWMAMPLPLTVPAPPRADARDRKD